MLPDLSANLFGITVSHSEHASNEAIGRRRVIDYVDDFFDDHLVQGLIDGRFAAGIPSPDACRQPDFWAPFTQSVYHLIAIGLETGFWTDKTSSLEGSALPPPAAAAVLRGDGGANLLRRWVNSLPKICWTLKENEILTKIRELLADRELFMSTCQAGDQVSSRCTKSLAFNGELHPSKHTAPEEELRECLRLVSEQADDSGQEIGSQDGDRYLEEDRSDRIVSRLHRMLKSKANITDLSRYLDLGHFDFPDCKVSTLAFVRSYIITGWIGRRIDRLY